jgi:Xaa-Pro aminopeptidase
VPVLFTDGRYTEQARAEVVGVKVRITDKGVMRSAAESLASINGAVAVEGDKLSVSEYQNLRRWSGKKLKPISALIERLRMIKEPQEVELIQRAINLASSVFEAVVPEVVPGVTESAIAVEIEYLSKRLGAEDLSFDTIVAAGKRSALPHGRASGAMIPRRGFVVFDFGVKISGYCSDMTRTVHVGRPDKRAQAVYNFVLEAQLAGIKAVKAGVETSEVDYAARNTLEKAGLGEYFTHSTGHGVGLEIHEVPGLRKRAKVGDTKKRKPDLLLPGMVITIEPGVYIPGWGGVRIEDMVLVTETGCNVLTPTAKELVVL